MYDHDLTGSQGEGAFAFRTTRGIEKHYWGSIPTSDTGSYAEWYRLFNASLSNSTYGASSTVQPAAGAVQYLIKY